MYEKYFLEDNSVESAKRFNFKAVVECYYYDGVEEYTPKIVIEDISIGHNGTIGIKLSRLEAQVKSSLLNLTREQYRQVMENFRDNSFSVDDKYITMNPLFILQSTGVKSDFNQMIFEGDIVQDKYNENNTNLYAVVYDTEHCAFFLDKVEGDEYDRVPLSASMSLKIVGNVFTDLKGLPEAH